MPTSCCGKWCCFSLVFSPAFWSFSLLCFFSDTLLHCLCRLSLCRNAFGSTEQQKEKAKSTLERIQETTSSHFACAYHSELKFPKVWYSTITVTSQPYSAHHAATLRRSNGQSYAVHMKWTMIGEGRNKNKKFWWRESSSANFPYYGYFIFLDRQVNIPGFPKWTNYLIIFLPKMSIPGWSAQNK